MNRDACAQKQSDTNEGTHEIKVSKGLAAWLEGRGEERSKEGGRRRLEGRRNTVREEGSEMEAREEDSEE